MTNRYVQTKARRWHIRQGKVKVSSTASLFFCFLLSIWLIVWYLTLNHVETETEKPLPRFHAHHRPNRKHPKRDTSNTGHGAGYGVLDNEESSPCKYDLTAVVMFRVSFVNDLLNFTHRDLEQWMRYMVYAGVQHFFQWTEQNQLAAYNDHFARHHPGTSVWETLADIDEYPFIPNDVEEGFLLRFARKMMNGTDRNFGSVSLPGIDQILIGSHFFYGPAETSHSWRIMRYLHREEEQVKVGRTKPLYRTEAVATNQGQGNMHLLKLLPKSHRNGSMGDGSAMNRTVQLKTLRRVYWLRHAL